MPKLFLLLVLVSLPLTARADFALDDYTDDLDVGEVALKGAYGVTVPASALAIMKINKDLRGAWKDALPSETKAFSDADRGLQAATKARDHSASEFHGVNDEYVKARDGYSYQTSRLDTQWQWVNVPQRDNQGNITGHTMQYQPVTVTVYDTHHVSPNPARAAELKPEMDRLKVVASEKQGIFETAEKTFADKKEILEKAERDLLDGRLARADGHLVEKIKGLQTRRAVAIGALSVAALVGVADIGSHLFSGRSLIDAARTVKRAPALEHPRVEERRPATAAQSAE